MGEVAETFLLTVGMALIGVQLLCAVTRPLAGLVVGGTVPRYNRDVACHVAFQFIAAISTWLVGVLVLHLHWYAALVAAMVVGITSYTSPAHF